MKRIIFILIVLIFTALLPVYADSKESVAENQNLVLYADLKTGDIAVKNKATGYIWYSNPQNIEDDLISANDNGRKKLASQIIIKYSKGFSEITSDSATGSVEAGGLKAERINDGVKFIYTFPDLDFEVPVRYTLENDSFNAEIVLNELKHKVTRNEGISVGGFTALNIDVDYNITNIDLLPYFGAGRYDENGYCLVPDGSGAIVNFGFGKELYKKYSAPVYGSYKDTNTMYALTDTVRLPVFGISKGNNGFLAVITSNEAAGFINVTTAGNLTSYTAINAMLQNKVVEKDVGNSQTQPITPLIPDIDNGFSVKYFFLNGNDSNYSGMAKCYRNYLINERGLKRNIDTSDGALYAELYGGVKKEKSILGIPWNVYEPLTTFDDIMRMTVELKKKGINNIIYKYNNWLPLNETGKVPNKTRFERAIGGKRGFKALIQYLADENISFYPDIDLINYSKNGNGTSAFFDCIKAPDQAPVFMSTDKNQLLNLGKRWYLLEGLKAKDCFMSFYSSFNSFNNGEISLSTISNTIYANNSPDGTKRGKLPEIWQEILKIVDGKVMTKDANAYALPCSKHIIEAPDSSSGNNIFDYDVPFYQIVLHGMISYSSPALNMASDIDKAFLKAVEYGASPMYKWIGQDPSMLKETYLDYIYSAGFEDWVDTATQQYKSIEPMYRRLGSKTIKSHSQLDIGIYKTEYEGGAEVIVNYNGTDFDYMGENVKAMGFIIR